VQSHVKTELDNDEFRKANRLAHLFSICKHLQLKGQVTMLTLNIFDDKTIMFIYQILKITNPLKLIAKIKKADFTSAFSLCFLTGF